MMERVFWIFTAAVLGLVVHLCTILYLPGAMLQLNLRKISQAEKPNTFFLMAPETQATLLPTANAHDVVGLCLIDVGHGTVSLSSRLPQGEWMLTIYEGSGKQVYSINDVEAGTGEFTVELSRAKGLLEQLRGRAEKDEAGLIRNVGWHAELNESRGIAVLWVPVADSARRPALEAAVRQTSCQQK